MKNENEIILTVTKEFNKNLVAVPAGKYGNIRPTLMYLDEANKKNWLVGSCKDALGPIYLFGGMNTMREIADSGNAFVEGTELKLFDAIWFSMLEK